MATKDHKEEFQAQLAKLTTIAAKSTSPGVTSKWIAASDEKVKALVFKKFDQGDTLAGVTFFQYPRRGEFAVVFDFESAANPVNLVQDSFLVAVDLVNQKVVDIVDPYLNEEANYSAIPSTAATRGTVPFTMRIPSNAPNVVVSGEAGAAYRAAERQFFRLRGIEIDPVGQVPNRPDRPGRPGGLWPDRPGFDLPERGNWGNPAQRQCRAFSPVATDLGTDTPTGNPPDQTDDVENDGHTDYVSDVIDD
jgi:hypothetical protein